MERERGRREGGRRKGEREERSEREKEGGRDRRREGGREGWRERRREGGREGGKEGGRKGRGREDVLPIHSIAHAHTFKTFETTLKNDRERKRCEEASRRERRQIQKVEDLRNKMLKEKLHRLDVEGLTSTQAEHVASLVLARC